MNRRNNPKRWRQSRIERLEKKCDRILSELIILRHALTRNHSGDAIEQMHRQALKLRRQCERERQLVFKMFNS